MKAYRTYFLVCLVFLFFTMSFTRPAQAARGRDYVMVTSGTLSVTLLGVLIYQAITAERGVSTSPSPDSVERIQEQAEQAVQHLGTSTETEDKK